LDRGEPRPSPAHWPAEPEIPQPEEFDENINDMFMDDNDINEDDINQPNDINNDANDDTNEVQAEEGPAQPRYFL
uniref:Serine/threonine protein kinase n=1 Tax=Anisakis simplex TaxID=6269 RepID=A0A0M3KB80_ANISI